METNTKTQKSVREEFLQKNVPCGLLTLQHVARKKKKKTFPSSSEFPDLY